MHRPVQRNYAAMAAQGPRRSRGEKIPLLGCPGAPRGILPAELACTLAGLIQNDIKGTILRAGNMADMGGFRQSKQ